MIELIGALIIGIGIVFLFALLSIILTVAFSVSSILGGAVFFFLLIGFILYIIFDEDL